MADDGVGLGLIHFPDGGLGEGVVGVEDGDLFSAVVAGADTAAGNDEAGVVQAGERHGESGAVFVAVVEADEGVVAVGAGDHFGGVGDGVSRGEGGVSALGALGEVIADAGDAEGEAEETGGGAAFFDPGGEGGGVDVAEVSLEEGDADADLGLVEVVVGESEAPVEGGDGFLPAVGEGAAVPVQCWILNDEF